MSRPTSGDVDRILAHLPAARERWAGYAFPPDRAIVVQKLMDVDTPTVSAPALSTAA